jgi:hypothetical protein
MVDFGFWISGREECWVEGRRKRVLGSGFWILDSGCIQNSALKIQISLLESGIVFCWFYGFVGCMSAVEVMDLVKDLPEPEALNLGRMLDDWLAGIVDRKFEAAVEAGAFDAMAAEALREAEAAKTFPLDEILDDRRVP